MILLYFSTERKKWEVICSRWRRRSNSSHLGSTTSDSSFWVQLTSVFSYRRQRYRKRSRKYPYTNYSISTQYNSTTKKTIITSHVNGSIHLPYRPKIANSSSSVVLRKSSSCGSHRFTGWLASKSLTWSFRHQQKSRKCTLTNRLVSTIVCVILIQPAVRICRYSLRAVCKNIKRTNNNNKMVKTVVKLYSNR